MADKPTQIPEWDTDEINIEEPAAGLIQSGWGTDAVPPSAYFNWWQNLVGLWIAYLDDIFTHIAAADWTWTGEHSFEPTGVDSFSVITEDTGLINLTTKLLALQHVADDTNAAQILWGSFADQRCRTFMINEALWLVWNAIYQDDGTWDFEDNAQRASAFVMGGALGGGSGTAGFLVRDVGEADGWTTANWHLSPVSFGAGFGAQNRSTPLTVATAQNGWAAAVTVKVCKAPDGKVTLTGAINGGTSGAACNLAADFPAMYRPATNKCFACIESVTNTLVKVIITTGGLIQATGTNTNVFLDGISYYE